MQTMNERRRPGADVGEAALSGLTGLARDLGIPASQPRNPAEVAALIVAIRERATGKARSLAFRCREIGERGAKVETGDVTPDEREAMARC